jgi:hypothetical protein
MSSDDDESFRPKLGPPKARGRARIPFVSRVLKASARAGHPIGHRVHSLGVRPGAKLGRGHVAARLAGQHLGPRARRVVIKTRLVVAKRSTAGEERFVTVEDIKAITDDAVQGNLRRRFEANELTGEWLIYAQHDGLNYYLALGRHDTGDDIIRTQIDGVCCYEFPFIRNLLC